MGIFRNGNEKSVKLNICGLTKESNIMICSIVKIDAVSFAVNEKEREAKADKLSLNEVKQLISKVHKPLSSIILTKKTDFTELDNLINILQPDAIQLLEENIPLDTVKRLFEKHQKTEFIQTVYLKPEHPVQKIKKQVDSFLHHIDAVSVDLSMVNIEKSMNWMICGEIIRYIKKQGKQGIMAGELNAEDIETAIKIAKPDMISIQARACAQHKETKEILHRTIDNSKLITVARLIANLNDRKTV